MEVAQEIDWRLPLVLTLAEATGRRIGAILKLRWEDVDLNRLPYGWIRFRAEHDKTGHEQWVPISEKTRRVLAEHKLRSFDSECLFPSERKPDAPVDRSTMDRRLRAAYEKAELQPLTGGLWHPWRRRMSPQPVAGRIRRRCFGPVSNRSGDGDEIGPERAEADSRGDSGVKTRPTFYPTVEMAPMREVHKIK
jgi:hypothetical protein